VEELTAILRKTGFTDIRFVDKQNSDEIIKSWKFGDGVEKMVVSVYIRATKPVS
jgi:hypothetical protein